jgi:lipid-A-disaccharide synthase-like uncharacterized protein
MIDQWREWLYPLGYMANLAFGLRFFWQWLISEREKKSIAGHPFWRLSLIGNFLLSLHALIQVQYHVSLIQAGNAIISWRHLDLMKETHTKRSLVYLLLLAAALFITTFFYLQSLYTNNFDWFHVPKNQSLHLSGVWHLTGFLAVILFSSRFWVQWWLNEKSQSSRLGLPFWWITFAGNIACLIYFYRIGDPANFIGPAFNFLPTIRNLMLIYQERTAVES